MSDTIITIITAFISAGLLTSLMQRGTEGRTARSAFLGPLAEMESIRWWSGKRPSDWDDFLRVAHELQAAAIICKVPKALTETYLAYATAARMKSTPDPDDPFVDEELLGHISSELNTAVNAMAQLAADFAWAPIRTRLTYKRRIREINRIHDKARPLVDAWFGWERHFVEGLSSLPEGVVPEDL